MCLALRCSGGVLLISPLCRGFLIVRDLWLIGGGIFYRSFVINLKTVRCGLSSSGLLLIKVELLIFLEKRRLAKLLEDEELYWKQRAKAFWLENGDLNTKFFHAQASGLKAANKVSSLVDDNGIV